MQYFLKHFFLYSEITYNMDDLIEVQTSRNPESTEAFEHSVHPVSVYMYWCFNITQSRWKLSLKLKIT